MRMRDFGVWEALGMTGFVLSLAFLFSIVVM
jgi:hypothetical protein